MDFSSSGERPGHGRDQRLFVQNVQAAGKGFLWTRKLAMLRFAMAYAGFLSAVQQNIDGHVHLHVHGESDWKVGWQMFFFWSSRLSK